MLRHILKRFFSLIFILAFVLVPFNLAYAGFTIAIVKSQDLGPYDRAVAGFKGATSNHVVEFVLKSEPEGNNAALVGEIGTIRPDVIFAVGAKAAVFARSNLQQFPLVYAMVINPDKYGLEGKNIFGIPLDIPSAVQFKLLKQIIPSLRRIGIIYDPKISGELVENAKGEAQDLGLSVKTVKIHNQNEVPNAIREMKDQVDALWMVPDSTVYSEESLPFIFTYTLDERIPFMAFSESFVDAGALLSLSSDYEDVGRQGSLKIDEILIGKAGNSSQPSRYRMVINLKTAKRLNIEIPASILGKASRIIDKK
ncbi:MAG TPA: ABC transporter substrate-binding protein [Nitrospiria bacterium]|nr:ABC transporter substrate-binding protein [Nitrospiria bacterium]